MTKWKIIGMLALASLMAGCGTSTFEGVHPTFTVTVHPLIVSLTPSPRPLETVGTQPAASSTAIPFTETAQAAPSPAATVTATAAAPKALIGTIDRQCLPIETSLPHGSLAEGAVIIGDFTERSGTGPLLILSSKDERPRPLSEAPSISLGWVSSPSAKWIAYPHVDERRVWTLIVLAGDGKTHASLILEDPISNWLDDERLAITRVDGSSASLDILNPFTGQRQTISPALPDFWNPYLEDPHGFYYGWWAVVYDPTLTRVAYTAGKEPNLSLVLWDLESNRELWRFAKHSTVFIPPDWSLDGIRLAAVALNEYEDNWDRFELYLVSRDGEATLWIDLRGYYVDSSITLKWSPDGRYIAIVPVGSAKAVLILDTASQQLLDYCISANAFADGYQAQIVWSPDSTQVIVPNQETPAIVIDLERKSAAYIVQDKDYKPVGWLIVSP